jgi:hypothetical protein
LGACTTGTGSPPQAASAANKTPAAIVFALFDQDMNSPFSLFAIGRRAARTARAIGMAH